jgi:hypothetical protein
MDATTTASSTSRDAVLDGINGDPALASNQARTAITPSTPPIAFKTMSSASSSFGVPAAA